mgnify:CR=1 FL=1
MFKNGSKDWNEYIGERTKALANDNLSQAMNEFPKKENFMEEVYESRGVPEGVVFNQNRYIDAIDKWYEKWSRR